MGLDGGGAARQTGGRGERFSGGGSVCVCVKGGRGGGSIVSAFYHS